MEIIEGDILETRNQHGSTIICHQVNCQGVMGAGLAKQIKQRWPHVFTSYRNFLDRSATALGHSQLVEVDENLFVANIFAQNGYGTNRRHTDYGAVAKAFDSLSLKTIRDDKVYIPYGMGCGLGGGDWDAYLEIAVAFIPDLVVVKYTPPKLF